jgi:cytochrome P450
LTRQNQLTEPDLADPDIYHNGPPHELLAELRATDPVHRVESSSCEPFWAVLTHADVETVKRQPMLFSSAAGGVMLEDLGQAQLEQMRGMLLAMDPPRHREVRKPLTPRFTPRAMAGLEADIRSICRSTFTELNGDTDLVASVSGRLPTQVIGAMMGLPREDWERVHALAERITHGQDPDYAASEGAAGEASAEMGMYAYQLAVARGDGDDATGDVTSVLLSFLSPVDYATLFVQLVTAGQDTTQTMLSSGLLALLDHPQQLAMLRADPSKIPAAIEEIVRWANPLHYFRRTATEDTVLGQTPIKAGDAVAMYYTSVNRDEDVFDDGQDFDIRRTPNKHLSFGQAEHFCVGVHLARLEGQIFFEELLSRFRRIEPTGEPKRLRSNLNNSYKQMPVKLAS